METKDMVIEGNVLIKYVGNNADIVIPKGVRKIKDDFIDLRKVRSLVIPKSVRHIGSVDQGIYEDETWPTKKKSSKPTIYFDCNLSEYLHIDNDGAFDFNYFCNVMIKEKGKYVCLQNLKEIKIPNDIRYLGEGLCYCNMEKVVLGEKVKALWNSFFMCRHLKEVVFNERLETIGEAAFCDCVKLPSSLYLPASVKTLGFDSFRNCPKLKKIYASKDLSTHTFGVYSPFREIDHDVEIFDLVTKKEIYPYNSFRKDVKVWKAHIFWDSSKETK